MEIIEILDEEIYDVNKCYGDSSSDNESINGIFYENLGFLVYKDGKNHMDASNDIQYSIGSGLLFRSVLFLITFLLQNITFLIHNVNLSKIVSLVMDDLNLHDYLQYRWIIGYGINANQCSTIISKGSRTKMCVMQDKICTYHPPPFRKNFKDNLQVMIKEATEKDDVVTSQGNILKAYLIKKLFKKSICH
ncbi:unnamed protein product [Rhizophagus irregularis]|nr:unnamed protein product [Rhizophagus irregularis]